MEKQMVAPAPNPAGAACEQSRRGGVSRHGQALAEGACKYSKAQDRVPGTEKTPNF